MYPVKTITENGTFQKRSPEWNFIKILFASVRVNGAVKTELSENADDTLSASIHFAQYY